MATCATPSCIPLSCGTWRFFVTENEEPFEILLVALRWVAFWAVVWLTCIPIASRFVIPHMPPSSKARENQPAYVGQKLATTVKVLVCCIPANYALLVDLWHADVAIQYGGYELSAAFGIVFTTFEAVDMVMCAWFGFLDAEYFFHHSVHIAFGFIMRPNCAFAMTAAVLLAQETSGIFLQYFLLMRNRQPDHPTIAISFVLFAICFFTWRLGLGTWGTLHYMAHYRTLEVPLWQGHILGGLLTLGSVLQWYWGLFIVKSAVRKVLGGKTKEAKGAKRE